MTYNVGETYINLISNEITQCLKLIFEKKYSKKISDKYIEAYLNIRFYNYYEREKNLTFRKNYLKSLKSKEKWLIEEYPDINEKYIENVGFFCYYLLYFDRISYSCNVDETIEKLYKIRKRLLNIDDETFKKEFKKTIENNEKQRQLFLDKFETEDFNLKITDYVDSKNVKKVKLGYNIKFPEIYSKITIDKVFKEGIISEDKLQVEYYLTAKIIIEDILKGNFDKQYIVEFEPSLLKKQSKLKSILKIINNSMIQDKINLKIRYRYYIENKEKIQDLMREGFRFSIIADDTLQTDYLSLESLKIFSYILLSKNLDKYDELRENKARLKNIIEI